MSKVEFYVVTKDIPKTQAARLDNSKFIGKMLKCSGVFTKSIPGVLRNLTKNDCEQYSIVGIVVPDVGAVFFNGHDSFSDGHKWTSIKSICKTHSAELTFID